MVALGSFFAFGGIKGMAKEFKVDEKKRKEMTDCIINKQFHGEVFIITRGIIWKTLVLRYFNQVKRGELSIDELVIILEKNRGVKYAQKHSLVRYPILECLHFIAKVTKQTIDIK